MKLKLWVEGKKIRVECSVFVKKEDFCFALAKSFTITKATCNQREILVQGEDYDLLYRPPMKKYHFTQLQTGELTFWYEGGLEGLWATEQAPEGPYSCLRDEVFAFSTLNGWYPMEFDADLCEVEVQVGKEWRVIGAEYLEEKDVWLYRQTSEIDCNIIGVCKEKYFVMEDEELSLFFPDERMRDKVEPYYRGYHENDKMGKMTLFFLPDIGEDCGGYKRDGLIVFTAVKEDIPSALHHIAHELAHSYAMGADCYSWEDWLNETHAEWNALLYELEKDEAFFECCLTKTRERYGDRKLALKENGEEHQEFVHEVGVLVYEKIYRRYGADSIRTILRTFDHLSEKSTAKLLETLTACGEEKLACMIESYC